MAITLNIAIAADIEALSFNKAVARIYELTSVTDKAAPSASRSAAIRALSSGVCVTSVAPACSASPSSASIRP